MSAEATTLTQLRSAISAISNPVSALPDSIPSGTPSRARAEMLLQIRDVLGPDDLADDPAYHAAQSWSVHRHHLPAECAQRIGMLIADCDRQLALCLPALSHDDTRALQIVRVSDFANGAVFRTVDMRGNNPSEFSKGQVFVALLEALPETHWLRPDPRFFEHWRLTQSRNARPLPGDNSALPPRPRTQPMSAVGKPYVPPPPTPFQLERERQHAERLQRFANEDARMEALAVEMTKLPAIITPAQCVRVALPGSAIEQACICLGAPLHEDCRAWLTLAAVKRLTDVQAFRQRINDDEAATHRRLAEMRQQQQDDAIRHSTHGKQLALEEELSKLRREVAELRGGT